jgi:hypothetical protein
LEAESAAVSVSPVLSELALVWLSLSETQWESMSV